MKKLLFLLLCCASCICAKQPASLKSRYKKMLEGYKAFKECNPKGPTVDFFQTNFFYTNNKKDILEKLTYDCSPRKIFKDASLISFLCSGAILARVFYLNVRLSCSKYPSMRDYYIKNIREDVCLAATSGGLSGISLTVHGMLNLKDRCFPGDLAYKRELLEAWKFYKAQQELLGEIGDKVEAFFENKQSIKSDPDIVFVGV